MLPDFFEFHNPTKVVYEAGVATDLKPELDIIGCKKYFIVSDKPIADLGLVQKIEDGLVESGFIVTGKYTEVTQDADLEGVKRCADQIKASGARGIIAIGGGSVIDTAKAANILSSKGGDLVEDYSGAQTLTSRLNPLIVIPTTAGTGSEVTMVAMVYDRDNKEKLAFVDKYLLPDVAVLDPEMTLSLPPKLTASTGMDALTHSMEAFVGTAASPISDAFASCAIELIIKNLVPATQNGDDVDARGAMLIGSCMAGIAFTHSMVGCVHGMAHATGALYRVPHGVANGIYLPYGLEYNFEEIYEKLAKLASPMGIDTSGKDDKSLAHAVIDKVFEVRKALNELDALPLRLRDIGVPEDGLAAIAEGALNDGTSFYNPREMEEETLLPYIQKAY